MLVKDIIIEGKQPVQEAPVGLLKRMAYGIGSAFSTKAKGKAQAAAQANSLWKDTKLWMGRSGISKPTADQFLNSPLFQNDPIMPQVLQQLNVGDGPIPNNLLQKAHAEYVKQYHATGGAVHSAAADEIGAEEPAAQAAEKPALAKDIEVIDADPMILRYRNIDYFLGDKGQWVNSKTNRDAPQSFQAFLNKQADIVDASMTATPTPAPKAAAPEQPAAPKAAEPEQPTAPAAKRTGGKVAGTVSMTPNAIRKRAARAAARSSAKI